MFLRDTVVSEFEKFVRSTFLGKADIVSFLLNHPKRDIVVDDVCEKLKTVELSSFNLTAGHIIEVSNAFAKIFCTAALNEKIRERQIQTKKEMEILAGRD